VIRRAVAPVEGMKGGLRSSRFSRERRVVQGRPRPAPISFCRRNERPAPAWGDPVPGYGWRFWRLVVVWSALVGAAAHIGLERAG
jgi:hypothetical protein